MSLQPLVISLLDHAEDLKSKLPGDPTVAALCKDIATLNDWCMKGNLAYFYYSTLPKIRYGWGKPSHGPITRLIEKHLEGYAEKIAFFNAMAPFFSTINAESTTPSAPYWQNTLLPVIDAISICGLINYYKPKRFMEIGSGNSTRFAVLAANTYAPQCEITSIDPYPGNTVEAFPHVFIKKGLEEADLSIFTTLEENDLLWLDGSHRSFSNTDVSVFFMDVLPLIKPGVIIGIHDIPLPWDYPPGWESYYFNELFVCAAYLIGAGDTLEYIFPSFYVNEVNKPLRATLDPLWRLPIFGKSMDELGGGGAFWFRKKP